MRKRYPTISQIQECYQFDEGARILDRLATSMGLDTLRNLTKSELAELLVDGDFRQALGDTIIDVRKLLRAEKSRIHKAAKRCGSRRRYCIYYMGTDNQTKSVMICGYSPTQAVGYLLSGKHKMSSFVQEIIEVVEVC